MFSQLLHGRYPSRTQPSQHPTFLRQPCIERQSHLSCVAEKPSPPSKRLCSCPASCAPADILLTRVPLNLLDTSTFNSTAIQAATGAPFSHAALCIEPGLLIEAIGTGVCRLGLGQTGARSNKNVKLLKAQSRCPIVGSGFQVTDRVATSGRPPQNPAGSPERTVKGVNEDL